MKYFALLLIVAAGYYFVGRSAPVGPVVQTVTANPESTALTTGPRPTAAPAGSALKRPLDRTHAVLDQVQERNGASEF